MKIRKRILLAFMLLLLLVGCTMSGSVVQTQRPYVAVITKSTSSAFWKSVQSGVKAAANEYNLHFTFEGPTSEEDWEAQNTMIQNAIDSGARAIVISAINYSAPVELIERAADLGIHIIIIDSDIQTDRAAIRIGTDNYQAGETAAHALLDATKSPLSIGIVGFDTQSENGQQREKGFEAVVNEDSRARIIEKINCSSQSETVQAETRQLLTEHPEINAIVTFNELTTLGVGHAIDELGLDDDVYVVGFDNNVVSVGMLETGEIDVLVVQNPFAMGYLALESAAMLISGQSVADTHLDTEVRAIHRKDMYTEKNQKFLFSFTQNQ